MHLNFVVCSRFLNKYNIKYQIYEVADNVSNLCQILDNDVAPAVSPVRVGLDREQIAIGFLALTCLLGPSDEHIKSLQLLDTGEVVNLHKFKMAAVQSLNLQITFFWLHLVPINVLQTFFGFNLFIH